MDFRIKYSLLIQIIEFKLLYIFIPKYFEISNNVKFLIFFDVTMKQKETVFGAHAESECLLFKTMIPVDSENPTQMNIAIAMTHSFNLNTSTQKTKQNISSGSTQKLNKISHPEVSKKLNKISHPEVPKKTKQNISSGNISHAL